MSMKAANDERPGRWGFFVSLSIIAVLYLVRIVWTREIVDRWPLAQTERANIIQQVCRNDFQTRAQTLLKYAVSIAEDSVLFQHLFQTDPSSVQQAFEELGGLRHSDNLTYEITDAQGAILCWSGKSADASYEDELETARGDTIVSLSERGLYTYLSVGLCAARSRAYVVVSHPLVVNYPISTRFLRSTNFTDNLKALLKTDFRLIPGSEQSSGKNTEVQSVTLQDFRGSPIGSILFTKPQQDALAQEMNFNLDRWTGLFIGLATLSLGWVALIRSRKLARRWQTVLASILAIWSVRFIWIAAEFPARIIPGDLFDPSMYSSSFLFGAASSLGETLISVFCLMVSLLVCFSAQLKVFRQRGSELRTPFRDSITAKSFGIVAVLVAILWSTRAFGAAIRSFVVDSTIAFHDPLTTLPSWPAFGMQVDILLLGISFILLVMMFSIPAAFLVQSISHRNRNTGFYLPPLLFLLSFLGFQWFNSEPILPWYLSLIVLLGSYGVADNFKRLELYDPKERIFSWKIATILILSASVFSLLVTDREIHIKEREQVRTYAKRLLQPLDSWISFVLNDGLRAIVGSYHAQPLADSLPSEDSGNLAFLFWTKTLMSQEGYNSAVVVYNDRNKEVSRFSVGLSSYEQREILTKAFDNEEESVVALDRTGPLGTSKSYALWSTIRNDQGKLIESVALLLSASERSIFGGEENETFLSSRSHELQNVYRPVAVSIFENGRLAATTHEELSVEHNVPQFVLARFNGGQELTFWTDESIGNKSYESLFARDADAPGKIVEVSLESIDYRWHIFDFLKLLSAAFLALTLLALVRGLLSLRSRHRFATTFRTKLLVSFLILGFGPLILLSYYNREFADQSLDEAVKKTLSRDLDIVSQRILSSAADEEDYFKGINNDFAESVSSDVGVDFTVYHRTEV